MKFIFKDNTDWKGSLKYYFLSFSYRDTNILNLDRQGRIMSFINNNGTSGKITYKKGFDGNWLGIKRPSRSLERIRFQLDYPQILELYKFIESFCEKLVFELKKVDQVEYSYDEQDIYRNIPLSEVINFWINLLKQVSINQNNSDKNFFSKIYTNIGILPPDRYGSLVIQVTTGCVYNKCAFCHLYQGIEYGYKKLDSLEQHVQDLTGFMGESMGRFHSIFIGDANALTIPFTDLLSSFDYLNNFFEFSGKKISHIQKSKPIFEGIYSFLDVFTGFKLTRNHFLQLAKKNLKMVYLGIESGSKIVLELLNKPNTITKIMQVVSALHEAAIGVAVIFLIGAGGKTYQQNHLKESFELIKKLNLNSNDIIYLSKLYIPKDSLLDENMANNNIEKLTEQELDKEYFNFKSLLGSFYAQSTNRPIISKYEILDFIY